MGEQCWPRGDSESRYVVFEAARLGVFAAAVTSGRAARRSQL
jgi:hypothetical protein